MIKHFLLGGAAALAVSSAAHATDLIWSDGPMPVRQFTFPDSGRTVCSFGQEINGRRFWIFEYADGEIAFALTLTNSAQASWSSGGTIGLTIDEHSYSVPAQFANSKELTAVFDRNSLRDFLHDLYNGQILTITAGAPFQQSYSLIGIATAITDLHRCGAYLAAQAAGVPKQPFMPGLAPAPVAPAAPATPASTEVPMVVHGNNFFLPTAVNGVPAAFLLDTGAADVVISRDLALTLWRNGTLSITDYVRTTHYTIADGRTLEQAVYRLHTLTVGNVTVHDVEAAIGEDRDMVLLGQSLLRRFSSWRIDNQRNVLVLG